MTLTDFLLARIAEDEAAAQLADAGPWHQDSSVPGDTVVFDSEGGWVTNIGSRRAYSEGAVAFHHEVANGEHIARHNPVRVLAECEAKRRLVELHRPVAPDPCHCCGNHHGRQQPAMCQECAMTSNYDARDNSAPCDTLLLLALPYVAHPDYREEWRP